ncbi:hypothetical protein MAFF212519_24970 [Clavibacter michiganensis]
MTAVEERTGPAHRIVAPADGARLRVVQVGAGGMGRQWLQTIAEDPDVELVGVVDLDAEAARAGASAHGASAEASTDLGELIARVRPDAVIDVTIPRAHHPVTTQALFAGIPVLGEKPVALTVPEGCRSRRPRRSRASCSWSASRAATTTTSSPSSGGRPTSAASGS